MGMSGHAPAEAVVGVTIGMLVLAAIAVVSRLATRVGIVRNPGVDDAFIVVALLFSLATTVTMILQVQHGMAQHQDSLSPHAQLAQLKPFWASVWLYNLAISCTKFSILFQYLRIFPDPKFRRTCYGLIGVVVVYTGWTFFSAIFACTPVRYFWDPSIPGGHCLDRFGVWFANAGINIVTDIATGLLPLPVFKQLELPRRQKYALMTVFALGGFTCVVSILRLQSLYVISKATDVSWNNPLAAIWSSVEINTGILCSCLPTLKACVSRFWPRLFTTKHSRSRTTARQSAARGGNGGNGSRTYASDPHHRGMAFADLGRGLSGRDDAMSKSVIHSRARGGSDADEYDLTSLGSPPKGYELDDGQIQVVTVVEQDVHRARSETDSMRGLVREAEGAGFYGGGKR
ncbi:hypothetical protein LTR53_016352 [Teratosphaeriaceae sp. CCFEE 6253]|nr:hypothetical protein LTR53_016352 [Teratosphaeriaceae sp. CCFEE 6253]